jgi:hypothetical protein
MGGELWVFHNRNFVENYKCKIEAQKPSGRRRNEEFQRGIHTISLRDFLVRYHRCN